jgi:thiamine biosynthesis lipoprotein
MISTLIFVVLVLNPGFKDQNAVPERYNLIVFEGSDWCVNCIRLERKILNDTSFIGYLDHENIRLIKVDFPQRKKVSEEQKSANEQIAEKYGFEGVFPTILLSRSDTMIFEKIYYQNQSVEEIKAVIQHKLQILQ